MANKKIAKSFIDDTSGRLLDNLYRVAKEYSDKKTAEKVLKDLIKTVIKIGILYRNNQFNAAELAVAERFKKKFRFVCMTVVSFFEVDFTFDKNHLNTSLLECSALLKELVGNHLTDKSLGRIDNVFGFFGNPALLEVLFRPDNEKYRDLLSVIVHDVNKMIEDGTL